MNREEFEEKRKALFKLKDIGDANMLATVHMFHIDVLYEILEALRYMNNPPQLREYPDISYTTRKLDGTIHNG